MTPEVLKVLGETGKFKFIKDTCCDLTQIKAKLDAVEGTGLKIYNANSATLLESLKLGCAGFSGVMANFHPEFYVWLCENFDKESELAKKIQDVVGFFSVAECQQYPVNAKYYQMLEGNVKEYISRARNAADFKRNHQLEIDQMYGLTQELKKLYNI